MFGSLLGQVQMGRCSNGVGRNLLEGRGCMLRAAWDTWKEPVKLCNVSRLWETRDPSGGATATHPGLRGSWNGSENTYGDWPNKLQKWGNKRIGTVCKQKNQQKKREKSGQKTIGLKIDRVALWGWEGKLFCVRYWKTLEAVSTKTISLFDSATA